MTRDAQAVCLSRHLPVRFDLAAETVLPQGLRRGALAHEIRKDLWRALQGIKGFSPAVLVTHRAAGVHVRAGGAVFERTPPKAQAERRIADLLARPDLRARWIAHCGRTCDAQGPAEEAQAC